MAHYPIKCVQCAHIATNNTVLFDIKDAATDMGDSLSRQHAPTSFSEPEQQDTAVFEESSNESGSFWGDDDDEETSDLSAESAKQEMLSLHDYMTYPELRKYCTQRGLDEPIPQFLPVNITPDFIGADIDDPAADLLAGIEFRSEKNGALQRATDRYCPVCRCKLPAHSGRMPTYNITMLGTSSTGKTVFLCALNWVLCRGIRSLPYGGSLSCIPANRNSGNIRELSTELFEKGILPGTTQSSLIEPLVFQMTYTLNGRSKSCLLAFADMRGEDLVRDDGTNLKERAKYFASADGFMLLVSPMNIPRISVMLNGRSDMAGAETSSVVHTSLMQNINDYIVPSMRMGQITAPSVIMLSKCDFLINGAMNLGIPPSNPVVAKEPPVLYTGTYFKGQHDGTQAIVSWDGALFDFLKITFTNPYFTSFSSLGQAGRIVSGPDGSRRVENLNLLHPLRVIDSVLYLLMQLNFLPGFYFMEAPGNPYAFPNLSKRELKARINAAEAQQKFNNDIISRWIANCT